MKLEKNSPLASYQNLTGTKFWEIILTQKRDKNIFPSITHFQVLEYDFFDDRENFNKTLKQLQDASFSVFNREKTTALAEMFSIELKLQLIVWNFGFKEIIRS